MPPACAGLLGETVDVPLKDLTPEEFAAAFLANQPSAFTRFQ